MKTPSAVAVLTVIGLVLVTIAFGLLGWVTGGPLIGAAVGAFQAGVSCLLVSWLVEQRTT